jgi:hypothetical protein
MSSKHDHTNIEQRQKKIWIVSLKISIHTVGPASREVPESTIAAQPLAQKPVE